MCLFLLQPASQQKHATERKHIGKQAQNAGGATFVNIVASLLPSDFGGEDYHHHPDDSPRRRNRRAGGWQLCSRRWPRRHSELASLCAFFRWHVSAGTLAGAETSTSSRTRHRPRALNP